MADITSSKSTTLPGTILGYFQSHKSAEAAIDALRDAGFQAQEVGMAAHSAKLEGDSSTAHGMDFWTKVRNFFEGDSAEPYAEEQSRGDLGTREITTADTTGSGKNYEANPQYGTAYGNNYGSEDLQGSLSGLSVPEEHSRYFGEKLRNGGALVTVTVGNRREDAIAILEKNGADIGDNAATYNEASTAYDNKPLPDSASGREYEAEGAERNLQLYGEVLRVHKDRISRGEVRLRKEVLTETQTIEVPVTREELVLERVAVDGRPVAGDAAFGGESEIRIPLSEERASIEKQPVVIEEVRVGKREVSSVEKLNEQVRREELKVEDETKTRAS